MQPHALVIEWADEGRASVHYSWGLAEAWGVRRRGWRSLKGILDGNTLTLHLNLRTQVTYKARGDGTLEARYIDGNRIRRATLRRLPR